MKNFFIAALVLILLALVGLLISSKSSNEVPADDNSEFEISTYTNDQYSYTLEYPDFLESKGEIQNGEGQSFSGQGVGLQVFGIERASGELLQDIAKDYADNSDGEFETITTGKVIYVETGSASDQRFIEVINLADQRAGVLILSVNNQALSESQIQLILDSFVSTQNIAEDPNDNPSEVGPFFAPEDTAGEVRLDSPKAGATITSPLVVEGEARGYWFFEGSTNVTLTNWDGLIIGEGILTAQGDWMTEDFVPFSGEIEFETPTYGDRGSLIIHKANASGLPEHDAAMEIVIYFDN